jgi:hypothetical protein
MSDMTNCILPVSLMVPNDVLYGHYFLQYTLHGSSGIWVATTWGGSLEDGPFSWFFINFFWGFCVFYTPFSCPLLQSLRFPVWVCI